LSKGTTFSNNKTKIQESFPQSGKDTFKYFIFADVLNIDFLFVNQ